MNMSRFRCGRGEPLAGLMVGVLIAGAMTAIFLAAPIERTMGETQKIVYVHVAVAWCGLIAFVLTAAAGTAYLVSRKLSWDHWAQASAEVGWLSNSMTLLTGSLWAHEAWNVWWTWDPRLTTSLVLWMIYAGYFILRAGVEDHPLRATYAAVLSLLGVLDVPLIVLATRWFRGVHPTSPEMDPGMHVVLIISLVAYTVFFAYLVTKRRGQLLLASAIESCELRFGDDRGREPSATRRQVVDARRFSVERQFVKTPDFGRNLT
jgi:heme exporter protein C